MRHINWKKQNGTTCIEIGTGEKIKCARVVLESCSIRFFIYKRPCRRKSSYVFLGMTLPIESSYSSSWSATKRSDVFWLLSFVQTTFRKKNETSRGKKKNNKTNLREMASSILVTLAKCAVLGIPKHRMPWAWRHSAKWRWNAFGPLYV